MEVEIKHLIWFYYYLLVGLIIATLGAMIIAGDSNVFMIFIYVHMAIIYSVVIVSVIQNEFQKVNDRISVLEYKLKQV